MKDRNQMIRYLGYDPTKDGGRQLRFSVDASPQAPITFLVTISRTFFTGDGHISFQEAAAICRDKLRQDLDTGTLRMSPGEIRLSSDDVAQHREVLKGRRMRSRPLVIRTK
jgi:hypothetical protein